MYKKIIAGACALLMASTALPFAKVTGTQKVYAATEKTVKASANDDWLHAVGGKIYDKSGNQVVLTGANWFGFNCTERMLHGLGWGADIEDVISQSADRGINLFRIPISTELLLEWKAGKVKDGYSWSNSPYYSNNPALVNDDGTAMNNLQVFDKMMALCKKYGVKVMVDVHSAEADNSGHNYPVWYKGEFTTDKWIEGWEWLVERYKDDDTLIACDLKNEPHGKFSASETIATKWDNSTDENNWKYAAEKCGKAILDINPNLLIMVEGIEQTPREGYTYESGADDPSKPSKYDGAWWGGNFRNAQKYPVDLGEHQSQLVYSPHDYGPAVYAQEWFKKDFTEQTLLDDYWYDSWFYLQDKNIAPLLIGEWGGFMDGGDNEKYMNIMAKFIQKNQISHTFWCINPNSGDTGGLLDNSWTSWVEDKYDLMKCTLWQDKNGKFIGLDHAIPLGKNGQTVTEYYGSTPTPTPTTKDLSECSVDVYPEATFTGTTIKQKATIKDGSKTLVEGTDYTIAYKNNAKVGTATMTITGKGDYEGSVTKSFKILPKSIKYCTVKIGGKVVKNGENVGAYKYKGTAIQPTVRVYIGKGEVYKGNYVVTYKNNVNRGTATIVVTAKKAGSLNGKTTYTFNIK